MKLDWVLPLPLVALCNHDMRVMVVGSDVLPLTLVALCNHDMQVMVVGSDVLSSCY